jgi:hypothetical protein
MNKKAYGVFCIALASLLLELVLIRVFDVLWYPMCCGTRTWLI